MPLSLINSICFELRRDELSFKSVELGLSFSMEMTWKAVM